MGKHQIVVNECTQTYLACDNTNAQVLLVTGGYYYDFDGNYGGYLSSTEVSLATTCIGEIGKQ